MSAPRPLRAKAAQSDGPLATDRTVLEALFAELREVNRKLDALLEQGEKARAARDLPGLVGALEQAFRGASFTVNGVLDIARIEPELAAALAEVIDMNAPAHSRATRLGVLLGRLPQIETIARERGVRIYRIARA